MSAFLTPHGSVVRLLRDPVRSRYELCLSDAILTETAEVLLAKSKLRRYAAYADDDVREYIRWLLTQAEMVPDAPAPRVVPNDPKDDLIVAAAVAAKADYLVTGDRAHLLPLGEHQGIRIISPRAVLDILV
ncbi:MAG TPA: putative toxin-antitoxin system toxin component, PIN family [Stellaceae bacterium]|nr:putative toxin-antitoxin system toxin component, PIN family [Stellaceae bacterium]